MRRSDFARDEETLESTEETEWGRAMTRLGIRGAQMSLRGYTVKATAVDAVGNRSQTRSIKRVRVQVLTGTVG